MFGQLIDLALVEMRDRLEVSRAVTVLDKKALVQFQQIWRSRNREIQAVGVEVFQLLCGCAASCWQRQRRPDRRRAAYAICAAHPQETPLRATTG